MDKTQENEANVFIIMTIKTNSPQKDTFTDLQIHDSA